jgi:predicted esterase
MNSLDAILHVGADLSQAKAAAILIHGRGSTAEDIAGLTTRFDVPGIAFLAPSAPQGAWYPHRFLAPLEQNEPWLTEALQVIDSVATEIVAAGIPARRIGLIGFSQGACLALEHAVRADRVYGFTAALSGALIGPLGTPRIARELDRTPVFLGCAAADGHIPLEHVEKSACILEMMNADVTTEIYPGSAHTVFPREVAWIKRQLREISR